MLLLTTNLLRRGAAAIALASLAALPTAPAHADPYLGEIRCFAFNFVPFGWAPTNGQLMSISQNTALFSLLGTFFGGNGITTFALPNLQQRIVIGTSATHVIGETGGNDSTMLTSSNVPPHAHYFAALGSNASADSDSPAGRVPAVRPRVSLYVAPNANTGNVNMAQATTGMGGGVAAPAPISNQQPYIAFNCAIALQGVYPSRN
jgi:microcystin-dependent protein